MAQFDVYRNPSVRTRKDRPYLIELQMDRLSEAPRRVVAPLIPLAGRPRSTRLTPVFDIEGAPAMLVVLELGALPRELLGERIASLAQHRQEIIVALDYLFTGV